MTGPRRIAMGLRKSILYGLTFGRIPMVLVFLLINLCWDTRKSLPLYLTGLLLLIIAALTDLFDGYYARKWNLTSRLGAHADPLTDKVFYITTWPTLAFLATMQGELLHARVLLGLAVVFLLRDQWVSFLRSVGALHGVDGRANWSGKARTVIGFPAICFIYNHIQAPAAWPIRPAAWFIYLLEFLCFAVNLVSLWVYTRGFWPAVRKEMKGE